jgi:primosomal protein N' (replication factor Y)
MEPRFAQVAVEGKGTGRSSVYTYRVPPDLSGRIVPGSFVMVPFGKRTATGYVVGLTDEVPPFALKDIARLQADEPLISAAAIALAAWVAENWCAGLSECLRPFLPPGGRQVFAERIGLLSDDLARLSSAPRQLAVAEALAALNEDVRIERLLRQVRATGWPKASPERLREALRALEDRGFVAVRQFLRPPAARPFTRRHVCIVDTERAAGALPEISVTSPRQALVLQALLASPTGLPLRDLPRTAVLSLERKGLVETKDQVSERRPDEGLPSSGEYLNLTAHQRRAVEAVAPALAEGRYMAALLHGVTGSGKTEVYLHCLRDCLAAGRNAIVLVPEIALTPQIVGRIAARFGSQVAVLHSALSPGQRFDEWQRLRLGRARIAVGPRSALFAPLDRLGLVVVDEEHEPAYKQGSSPRYHARPVAFELARRHNAVLLLGSATPSIETFHAAQSDAPELSLFELPERIDARPLPAVKIVDLREDVFVGAGRTFSEPLLAALGQTIERGEQAILFLNRRGFATYVVCRGCGHGLECPDCGVSLTYHHTTRMIQCHYCSYARPMPSRCDECGSEDLGFLGLGTQRVAEQLLRHFPDLRLARLDRDSVRRHGTVRDVLAAFARGETQVLVGTQMVAKGLDFPGVTMVGVLNADVGLSWSDFRASERTFQLITQVAGRAGRADKPGLVVVQTYKPDHPAIVAAADHDYARFYAEEIEGRRLHLWPPFVFLARLLVADADEARCLARADAIALALRNVGIPSGGGGVHYIGPAKAPLERLRGEWRYHLVVKSPERAALREAVEKLLAVAEVKRAAPVVDIDPADML